MTKQLLINGEQNFMGVNIPVIEGGFGETKRCVLAKDIASIHEMELKEINQSLKRLIEKERIKKGVHYIDLLDESFKVTGGDLEYKTSNGQKSAFLLSERGYISLIKYMNDDKSWEVMDKFVDEYFTMRKVIEEISEKDRLLLGLFSNDKMVVAESHKQLVKIEVDEAVAPLKLELEENKPLVEFANTITESSDSIDVGQFAKLIKDEGIKLGRNKLFDWLRDNSYLRANNEPYQRYIDNGVFETKEYTYKTPYGTKLGLKTLVLPKGQVYLVEKLRKEMVSK